MSRGELFWAVLFVGLGGFCGSAGRYLFSLIPIKGYFPVITFLTNFMGAVIIGFLVEYSEVVLPIPPKWMLFLKTGFCGGFTTFSTYSLETVTLLEQNYRIAGYVYAAASLAACFAGILLGKKLARMIAG